MSDDVHVKLDEILRQAKATNGRVTALELDMGDVKDVLYGDTERQTTGLVAQSHDVSDLLRQWTALTKMAKWAAGAFGAAAVGLAANLLGTGIS